MPRTKIICTIGPSSDSKEVIKGLINTGMNVERINFSHGTHDENLEKIENVRTVSKDLKKHIAILADLCGPKIRIGKVKNSVLLKPGQDFILTNENIEGTEERVSVSYFNLPSEVKKHDRIMLADGLIELLVKKTSKTDIFCEVITGGVLSSNKGINLPTGTIETNAITEKDKKDLLFVLSHGVDYIALSFVRQADDVLKLKKMIEDEGKSNPVIAKIEKHEALIDIDDIMNVSDGIMVARGDLGVEIPLENVPNIQKMLITKANSYGKPVIVATQMLRSMVNSPRPTRAEATDVANSVLDGADAIMLSEETSTGEYPIEAVKYMARIAESAEKNFPYDKYIKDIAKKDITESVAYAACVLANHLETSAILATTKSGVTAIHISRYRPRSRIVALSPDSTTVRRLSLLWGCEPCLVEKPDDTDDMIDKTVQSALKNGVVSKDDIVVITAGQPVWYKGITNMIRVKKIR